MAKKFLKIAGVKIEDPDVALVLEATKHLDPYSRKRVLSLATKLVEWDQFGYKPRFRSVRGMSLEALLGKVDHREQFESRDHKCPSQLPRLRGRLAVSRGESDSWVAG
jgi:hypothetical protein